jgi:steroid 5-alpha reductase family enzyme
LILCAILVTAWGIRLTYNFARKGGYSGEEDYRWAVLRNSMSKLQFQIFNIFFISIYQNLLLVLITIPAYFLYQKDSGWNALTIICIFLFILALIGETVADQQQWNFHQLKRENKTQKKFLEQGLFSLSRHPNFFFEQCQWWLLYLIVGFSTNHLLNYSIIGPVLLTLLFLGSTRFTESISLSKYPEYSQYQSRVPGIIPVIGWKKRN